MRRGELIDGKLPPILPLVLYNGRPIWTAAQEVEALFAPSPRGLESFRPKLRYHLIDEARLMLHPSGTVRHAVEALFRLEQGRTPADLQRVVHTLVQLLNDPQLTGLRRSFTIWIKSLLRRKTPARQEDIDRINDLMEADAMLAETMEGWFEDVRRKGMQQGMQQGMQRGIQLGRTEGMQAGEAASLRRLLQRRFGPLPAAVEDRIAQADIAQIEAWLDRVLDAPDLASVLDPTQH